MQYLLLIYENEANRAKDTEADSAKVIAAYKAFNDLVGKTGNLLGGNALQPIATATTIRVRDGQTVTTDGPFAETKEQLGGYYLVDATDLDEALAIAAKIPGASSGCVEVRPVWAV